MPEPREVQSMFARISGRYDLLNRVLSMGIDRRWRKAAVGVSGELEGAEVLDVCTGTGDLALAYAGAGAKVLGVDFTREMLVHMGPKAARQGRGAAFVWGDAMRLPVRSNAVDLCSVAFGIRNVSDHREGLVEMARVVRPGGRVVVLEFTKPPGRILGGVYKGYFTKILPRVGALVSGDRAAYEYLPRTVLAWPAPDEFADHMRAAGLENVSHRLLTRGIACLHWGFVPEGPA